MRQNKCSICNGTGWITPRNGKKKTRCAGERNIHGGTPEPITPPLVSIPRDSPTGTSSENTSVGESFTKTKTLLADKETAATRKRTPEKQAEEKFTAHDFLVYIQLGGEPPDVRAVKKILRDTDWDTTDSDTYTFFTELERLNPELVEKLAVAEAERDKEWVNILAHSDVSRTVEKALLSNMKLSETNRDILLTFGKFRHWEIGEDEHTPAHILWRLAIDGDAYTRRAVASNRNIPPELSVHLFRKKDDRHLVGLLAQNPSTPESVLTEIVEDIEKGETWALAAAEDIAQNPELPPRLAERLYRIEGTSNGVQEILAGNRNTPVELLAKLAESSDAYVRMFVAENPNTSPAAMGKIWEEYLNDVAESCRKNPRRVDRLKLVEDVLSLSSSYRLEERINRTAEAFATNPNTPPEILVLLGNMERNYLLGEKVLANPNTPPGTLRAVVGNPGVNSLELVRNVNAPADLVDEIFMRVTQDIKKRERSQSSLIPFIVSGRIPPKEWEELADTYSSSYGDGDVSGAIARSPHTSERTLRRFGTAKTFTRFTDLLNNPSIPADVVDSVARRIPWETEAHEDVAYALIENKKTSTETLQFLLTRNFYWNDSSIKYELKRRLGVLHFEDYPMFRQSGTPQ